MQGVKEEKGAREAAELGNVGGATMAAAEKELAEWEKGIGLSTAFDVTRGARRLYAERNLPTAEYLDLEKRERLQRELIRRLGPAGVVGMAGPSRAQAEIIGARDVQGMLAAGARGGAVDTGTRLDLLEQQMLRAANVPEERIQGLQTTFEAGHKDDFRRELTATLDELRRNYAAGETGPAPGRPPAPAAADSAGMEVAAGMKEAAEAMKQAAADLRAAGEAQQAAAEKTARAPTVRQELD